MDKKEIVLRYCGGCNPRYNRGELTSQLERDFPGLRFDASPDWTQRYAAALVVCGCSASCADQRDLPAGLPRFVLWSEKLYGAAAGFLCQLEKEI